MDVFDSIATKLDVREFSSTQVPSNVRLRILEAARLTQSSKNTQHWRFILIQRPESLANLANHSTTGKWVAGANFAILVLTDPSVNGRLIDAGRAVQDMQLTAWSYGVASGIFVGFDPRQISADFDAPQHLQPTCVVGFGYPVKTIVGKKRRLPLEELAYLERYGNPVDPREFEPAPQQATA